MSNNKVSQQSSATLVVTLFALAFTLSSLPGLSGQELENGTSDLSSQVRSCNIDGQISKDGDADCNASVAGNNKIKGNVHIEKVAKTESSEGGYMITGEFSVTCSICEEGVRTATLDSQVENLTQVQQYLEDQAKELADNTKRDEDLENCKIDNDGEEMSKPEQIECKIEKMSGMEEKEARRYYDKHIKGELAALAESQNPQDAALAASLAGKLHQQMGVNCASTVAMAQQSAMAQQNSNPFNLTAPQASYTKSTPTDYIKESSCDIMMMANFNGRLNFLGAQLKGPNGVVAAKQIQDLQGAWSGYFQGRGFNLQTPMMNQINMDAGSLMTQVSDFNKTLSENYDAIAKRHADLLGANQVSTNNPAVNANGNRDLRLLRGGGPLPEQSNNTNGTPAVTPFPGMNNNNGMNLGNQFKGPQMNGPVMNGQQNAPAVLAPKLDTPVGS